MSRIVLLVMVVVVGLWVAGQAANVKRMVDKRHAVLMDTVEVIEK